MGNDIVEVETKHRIKIAVYAYAYEVQAEPLVSDEEYDELAKQIDLSIDTKNPGMDAWFRKEFHPYTGLWVHNHPDKHGLKYYANLWRQKKIP